MPIKILIAGGRDFTDKKVMHAKICELGVKGIIDPDCELICGMARGADMTAYELFRESDNVVHEYWADWDGLGKRAGFVRNHDMGEDCDVALIFWDGKSKGTGHMIDILQRMGKPHYVVRY